MNEIQEKNSQDKNGNNKTLLDQISKKELKEMYKKHGSTMNKMFKGKDLSPNKAFSVLQYIDDNPDMSYVEIKNKLVPTKKQKLMYGGRVHRGRTANGNKD